MKTVIFDMDGVIIDSEPYFEAHMDLFMRKLGQLHVNWSEINLRGSSARSTWSQLIKKYDLDYDLQDIITEARQHYMSYLETLEDMQEIPGISSLIKHLHDSGYRLGLASSANPRRIELFLTKLRLKQYFKVVISDDDVKCSKPAPDIFLKAAEKLGSKPKDCVVVEDAHFGVRAAKAAGMKCIAYNGSKNNVDDLSEADLVIKDFNALVRSMKTGTLPV